MKILEYSASKPQICVRHSFIEDLRKYPIPEGCIVSPHGCAIWRDIATWQDAELFFMQEASDRDDFLDIIHLSKKDAIFPFDFQATYDPFYKGTGEKFLIDVTMRTCKPVRTKRLSAWRAMGYIPAVFFVFPQSGLEFSLFAEIEPGDTEVRITKSIIREVRTSLSGPDWKNDHQQQLKVRN